MATAALVEHATVLDVARRAGVSPATVSNALIHPERVAPATADRIRAAMDDLSFVPNGAARRLRRSERTPALILHLDPCRPFDPDIARGVELEAGGRGIPVLFAGLSPSGWTAFLEAAVRSQLPLTGVISDSSLRSESLARLLDLGVRVVVLDEGGAHLDGVERGRGAVRHFAA